MDRQRWPRVKELFGEALKLPSAERAAWLERECAEDSELRDKLAALLAAHELADTFMEGGAAAQLSADEAQLGVNHDSAAVGERIGPYRLLDEIGRGGMGSVRLAVRDDDAYRQRVAIKLIKRGMDTDEIVRRFENERQILAGLVHPGIARLLDGGTTEDGRPYFVMEAIDGRPIDRYCEEESIDLESRLRLFLTVCRAVAFAHRNLVVHRDLKPANILVTDEGEPRLLDFGIAKLLGPALAAGTLTPTLASPNQTAPMTPEYASPEQLAGAPVTTVTDVYGLGLLLYVLFAGCHPFVDDDGETSRETARERIVEGHLRPPSDVHRAGQALDGRERSESRVGDLAIDSDLDAIVLQAMAVEPERRYGSVQELAADIERYLGARPISARRPTLRYRAGKFVRRHKVGTAFAASLVLGALLLLIQGFEVARQRDLAEAQRNVAETQRGLAETQRNRARSLSSFLIDLFVVADPSQSRGETVTARELLDEGARRLLDERASESLPLPRPVPGLPRATTPPDGETRADLLYAIGTVYQNLGLLDPAREVFEQSLSMRPSGSDRAAGNDRKTAEFRARTLVQLGHLDRTEGEYDAAADLYRRAERELLVHFPADDPVFAEVHNAFGLLYKTTGESDRAAEALGRAVEARRRSLPNSLELADSLSNLAAVETERQAPETAEALLDEARKIHRRVLGTDHPRHAAELGNLAALRFQLGDYSEAETLFEEALALRRRLLDADHPELAVTLSNLSVVQHANGHLDAAEASLREALAIHRGRYSGPHADVAHTLNNLAAVVSARGDLASARQLYEQAIAESRAVFGDEHWRVANGLNNLALVLRDAGELDRALALARDALRMRRAVLDADHPAIEGSLSTMADLQRHQGRLVQAEALYREVLELRGKRLAPDHPDIARSLIGLGSVLVDAGRAEEAQEFLERGLSIRQAALDEGHPSIAVAQSALAACYTELGHRDRARTLLVEALARLTESRGPAHADTQLAQRRLDALK